MIGRLLPPEDTEIAFYLGDILVTTNPDKKIRLALYGDDMMKYLQEKYEWTFQHTNSINLKATSLSKNQLTHAESIRASKMMHKWLNVGYQKEKMNGSTTDVLCPC